MIDPEAQPRDLVDQAHFEGEILVLGVAQAQALSLVLAPSEELTVGVDGGLDVDSRVDRGHPDVGAELVAPEEGVGDLNWSSTEFEGRPLPRMPNPHTNTSRSSESEDGKTYYAGLRDNQF